MADKTIDLPTASADADYARRFDELLMNAKKEMQAKAPKPDQQYRDFVKAARDLGCDESEESFDRSLSRIASAPPPKSVQKRKKKPRKR
ncbi:MAG: hypothetical protein HC869_16295 [Rhodospirillales bacterium]|nr:hypothetical protein [Rhodospirillales bacterium]